MDTTDDMLDFAALDAFRMRPAARSPERIEREAQEAAKSRAAARAHQAALNNGATVDEANQAARKAAATFAR